MNFPAWRFYFGFYKGSYLRLAAIVGSSFALIVLNLLILILVRYAFDAAIPAGIFPNLVGVGIAIAFLYLVHGGIMLWTRSTAIDMTTKAIQRLRNEILLKIYSLPRSYSTTADRSKLHAIFVHDSERLDVMSNALIALAIPGLFITISIFGALIYLNWSLAILLVLFTPFLFLWNKMIGGRMRLKIDAFHKAMESYSKGTMFVLRVMDLTRLQSAEQLELERQGQNLQKLGSSKAQMVWLNTAFQLGQNTFISILSIIILIMGGSAVSTGQMTLGELLTFYAAVAILKTHLQSIGMSIPQIIEGDLSLTSLYEWLKIDGAETNHGIKRLEFEGNIELKNVEFLYDSQPVLEGINLKIEAGTTVAIYGPNGAGKTTITNLILGFHEPTTGQIFADGQLLTDIDIAHYRRSIGVVRQDPIFFPGSILENITYGSPITDSRTLIEMAELATAHSFINQLPNRYQTFVGEDGVHLSGGQRQKIAITRALIRKPRLLILDEPTLNLDVQTVKKLMINLKNLEFSPTILLISHDINVIKAAQNIFVLHDGRVVMNGSYTELDLERLEILDANR